MPAPATTLTPGMVIDAKKFLGLIDSAVAQDKMFDDMCRIHYGAELWAKALAEASAPAPIKEQLAWDFETTPTRRGNDNARKTL